MIEVTEQKITDRMLYGVPDGKYYSVGEFCIIYNLTKEQVRKWKQRGHIRTVTIFGKDYIPVSEPPYEGKNGRPKRKKV